MSRIVIVGAGIAGLHAALTLQDAGLACHVYEASDRVGGRMHSDALTWGDGMVSEWCGEFIDRDHDTLHQLIRRFGLKTIDLGATGRGQARTLLYFLQRYPDDGELVTAFQQFAPVLQQQLQEIGFPTTYAHHTEAGREFDQLSVSAWIERYVEGGLTTTIGRVLNASCTGLYGLDASEQSALNLIYLFGARDLTQGSVLSRPLQGASKIMGGNAQLPQAIARSLPADCLHRNHQLVALAREPDASLTLTFDHDGKTVEVHGDHVILALPFSTLRRVEYQRAGFDALKQTAIQELGYGTISKLALQFDQPYWYADGPWPHPNSGFIVTDLDVQTFWDTSSGQNGSNGLLVNYTSGRRGAAFAPPTAYATTNESAEIQRYAWSCVQQLEQVLPGISAHYTGKAALSYPTGDMHLLGSYACWRVGQYTQFAGYEGVRQGNIHFAGEHCSSDFQGYMEGAAREGARAAQEILQDMSLTR